MQKLLFSSLLIAGITPLHAQESPEANSVALPEMVVTATRTDTPKNQITAGATVYTRADIVRLQVKTFPDLLRGTTGLDMVQQGGDGKLTSVFMRGTNSSHVLVLVDGIKFGSATAGISPFEFVPIDQVERVEIIRGPQSSLYGSEAIGGVIQIFTRKGGDSEKPKITLNAGGGTYNTIKAGGTISGKWQNTWYTAGASHYNTQGFNATQDGDPDKDGYYNTSVNARIGHRFDNNAEIDATFLRAEGKTKFDGFSTDKTKFVNQVASITGSLNILDNWRSTLRLGQSFDDSDQFKPNNAFFSRFNTTRWNASWLNQYDISDDHQLVFGADYRLDEIESSDTFAKKSRYDVGVFSELHSKVLDNHFINASLRYDHNQAFGNYVTGNIGWRYNSPIGISPFASFGNAFKSPTFSDLYGSGFPPFQGFAGFQGGNPNLQPEQSSSFEVGVTGTHDWGNWELRAYHTDIDNLITFVDAKFPALSSLQNVKKAQIEGLEAEVSTHIMGWNSKLSLNLLDPKDRETGLRLLRRSNKILSFDLSRSFGQFDVGTNILAQDSRPDIDNIGQRTRVAGFVTVNLRAAYHVSKNWTLNAALNNLLDKQYQTVYNFNTADRNFFLSINYNN